LYRSAFRPVSRLTAACSVQPCAVRTPQLPDIPSSLPTSSSLPLLLLLLLMMMMMMIQAGKQKRRGPLPLFLAEVLVLGSFVGVGLASTKYSDQTSRVVALAGQKGKELYAVAAEALAKAQQQSK
jgi:hypothetical protein